MPYNDPQEELILNGVMDQDSADHAVAPNNYRYAYNLLNKNNGGKDGTHVNLLGTVLIDNPYLPGGNNRCIGTFEDLKGQSIIFAVYNSNGYHGWYRWFQNKQGYQNGVIERLYQVVSPGSYNEFNPDPLGFVEDNLITGIQLVDDLLFWAQKGRQPKCMNIKRSTLVDKYREFNIYFNQLSFTASTTYTINLYDPSGIVYSLVWTSTAIDYVGRVNDLVTAAQGDPVFSNFLRIEDKIQYGLLTCTKIGDYYIDILESTVNKSYAIANNFYPDTTPTPATYMPMSEELITAVKYPPFRQPNVKYGVTYNTEQFRADTYHAVNNPPSGVQNTLTWVGFVTKQYDTNNYVTLGGNVQGADIGGFISIQPPNGYITNTGVSPILVNVDIKINFSVLPNSWLSGSGRFLLKFGKFVSTTQLALGNILYLAQYNTLNTVQNKEFNFNITIAPGEKWALQVDSDFAYFDFSSTIVGVVIPQGANKNLTTNAYQFRAKYIYQDSEESVYGAISEIPFSTNPYQDKIDLDFSDPRLSIPELSAAVKNVVLAVSDDNGTTWNDFKKLYPFEFVGEGRQSYPFTSKDILTPIAAAVSDLPFHGVPVECESLEYIDDRIFYGDLTLGYNTVTPRMEFLINIIDLANIDSQVNSLPPSTASYWRRGGEYIMGIEYQDDADRKSLVTIDPETSKIKIPYYNEDGITPSLGPATVDWAIYHEPPAWATKYQLVRTKDLTQTDHLLFVSDALQYINTDGSVGVFGTAAFVKVSFANIPYYQTKYNLGAKIAFPFVNGDRIRCIKVLAGVYEKFNDHEIVKVDGTDVYFNNDFSLNLFDNPLTSGGDLWELYTPSYKSTDNFFYEFGECYPIKTGTFSGVTSKYHAGPTTDQFLLPFPSNTSVPATGTFNNGDVFYRSRYMPFRVTGVIATTNDYISSDSPSEYIDTTFYNTGRVNSTGDIGQVNLPTGVTFTDRYVTGTQVNGLNAVQPANNRVYSTIYGSLLKMKVIDNDVLRLIFANGYQLSLYVNQGVIRQSGGGANLVSIYDDVAGNSHIIQRTLSTLNPESVVLNDEGDLFGYDEKDGSCWRSSGNGTINISDYHMTKTWADYADKRILLNRAKSKAPAVYDLYKDLFIITLSNLSDTPEILPSLTLSLRDLDSESLWNVQFGIMPNNQSFGGPATTVSWFGLLSFYLPNTFAIVQHNDGTITITAPSSGYSNATLIVTATPQGGTNSTTKSFQFSRGQNAGENLPFEAVTLAFSKGKNGWPLYMPFEPEYYGRLKNTVVSFIDGKLHLHDAGAYSTFYGVQKDSVLKYVVNRNYPAEKNPLSVWYRGRGKFGAKVFTNPNDSYPLGQETEMIPAAFELVEGMYSTVVMKNKLDPSFTNPQQAWVNGEDLKGTTYDVQLSVNDNKEVTIESVKNMYFYSDPN